MDDTKVASVGELTGAAGIISAAVLPIGDMFVEFTPFGMWIWIAVMGVAIWLAMKKGELSVPNCLGALMFGLFLSVTSHQIELSKECRHGNSRSCETLDSMRQDQDEVYQ
jgi:hypothetical protein